VKTIPCETASFGEDGIFLILTLVIKQKAKKKITRNRKQV